ncbi:hypothetical protein LTR27_000949 [Elasticomyces elasticus]|nr:hypothetical protein LTR27_000949 [Elasticomyces elasticus]
MSWMGSWSRPTKSQAVPPPLYLTHEGVLRSNSAKASDTAVKYCSDRCKRAKPSTAPGSLERRIEAALTALLQGLDPPPVPTAGEGGDVDATPKPPVSTQKRKPKKGDPRIIIALSELETAVFGDRSDPEKIYGRRKNRKARFVQDKGEWKSVDMVDRDPSATHHDADEDSESSSDDGSQDEVAGVPIKDHVRAPQSESDQNFSSMGGERGWAEKIEETPEMLAKRREGQKRAEEKEMVKCGARRAVAFGLLVDAPPPEHSRKRGKKGHDQDAAEAPQKVTRKCEALMNGQVAEPSFAKGDWSVRWREE